jgi:GT2 family glycosyltransferase
MQKPGGVAGVGAVPAYRKFASGRKGLTGMKALSLQKKIKNAIFFWRVYGFRLFVKEVSQNIFHRSWQFSPGGYRAWIKQNEPAAKDLLNQKGINLRRNPKISIIVPASHAPSLFLEDMLDSLLDQTYTNWELCIAGGADITPRTRETLVDYGARDARIRIQFRGENDGIAGTLNETLSLATGAYIAFLGHGDTLAPFALFEIAKAINDRPEADFIYSDEDLMSGDGRRRYEPHFKPDWSPDNLRSCNYVGQLTVTRKDLLLKSGDLNRGVESDDNYDLILRATESAESIVHIPKILYHRRMGKHLSAEGFTGKPAEAGTGKKALQAHLQRLDVEGDVEDDVLPGLYRITYRIDHPGVSIIIPSRDRAEDLEKCVRSILDRSSYREYEIIIVENGSGEDRTFKLYDELKAYGNIRIVTWEKPFNYSAVNNHAARLAGGEVLLFLNNDTEVINPDWLERMLEHAVRKVIGAVGAKLYYPDHTIQHAGVVLRKDGRVLHSHRFFPGTDAGYKSVLRRIQNVSAVTGACMMMRKQVFEEVGGFDEAYEILCGDIDLCLRVREKGYLVLWTPYAELYHDEVKTRGYANTAEKRERAEREEARFMTKWKSVLEKGDPYYSPNLSQDSEDFAIKL